MQLTFPFFRTKKSLHQEKGVSMTKVIEKNEVSRDYYTASLENGSLQLQPYCACGNSLNEDYFCEKCQRKCRCTQIICRDPTTLDLAKRFIRKSSQFSGFIAKLAQGS
jgi:hypothetical protein